MSEKYLNILCIEDSPSFVKFLQKVFEPINNKIDFFSSIKESKEALLNTPYDLIILDLNINDSYGLNTLLRIKSLNKFNSPILIVTSNRVISLLRSCLDNGADDVIVKPIDKIHNFLTKVFLLVDMDRESKNSLREKHRIPDNIWNNILNHF